MTEAGLQMAAAIIVLDLLGWLLVWLIWWRP